MLVLLLSGRGCALTFIRISKILPAPVRELVGVDGVAAD